MTRSTPKIPLLPSTLRARLTVTIVMSSVLIFILVYGVTTIATTGQATILARETASDQLGAVRDRLTLEARYLDSYLVAYTEWHEFYDRTITPDPAFTSEEVDPWLRETSGATVVVWADANGTAIVSSGSAADVERVTQLTLADPDLLLAGPVRLPSGVYVLAARPVVGDPAHDPAGFLAIAKPVTATLLVLAEAPGAAVSVSTTETVDTSAWTTLDPPAGFTSASMALSRGEVRTTAALIGIDGAQAGVVEVLDSNRWYASSSDLARYALPLGLGLISLLLGLGLGLGLGRLIRRPIEDFVDFMRDQGFLAIEGLPLRDSIEVDPQLPNEFQDLGNVIDQLLRQLRDRQAELKRVNEQAIAAEQAFRTVVNDSAEVKLLVRGGVVDIANPAAAACLGVPVGMVLGQRIEPLLEPMNMTAETGEPLSVDDLFERALDRSTLVRCDAPDHGERWMRVTISESDAPGTYLVTARNVTEEHRLEALRAEIFSLVSHDLRAPLTVISGYLELLSRPLDDEAREKACDGARSAANRMSSLLGELLETTRAEQVFAPSRFEKVRLGILADEVAEAMRLGTDRTIVVVKRRRAVVLGDDQRLRQAVENLVGNAIKHTPEGSDVTIVVDADDRTGRLCVEDHGAGVPEEQRESVFDRFTQLRAGGDGVGLGLYIVKVIAESHGGTAHVESADGGGARFVLEVPLAPVGRRIDGDASASQEPDDTPSA